MESLTIWVLLSDFCDTTSSSDVSSVWVTRKHLVDYSYSKIINVRGLIGHFLNERENGTTYDRQDSSDRLEGQQKHGGQQQSED